MHYEDRITIPTPEGVSLEMTLAGLGSRTIAGTVDLILKGLIVGLELLVLLALFGDDVAAAVVVPAIGLTMLVYDVLFETLAGGRTPGKRGSGLRVVRSSGRPVDLTASLIRNALRVIDGPLFYTPAFISIAVTKRNQRLGDLAADTVVIRDRRAIDREHARFDAAPASRPPAAAAEPGHAAAGASWDVSAVAAEELATVRAFLDRRNGLAREPRARLAAQLDGALRPRVGGADVTDPERFLEILYDAKRARG